jgi:hypothetical protein
MLKPRRVHLVITETDMLPTKNTSLLQASSFFKKAGREKAARWISVL